MLCCRSGHRRLTAQENFKLKRGDSKKTKDQRPCGVAFTFCHLFLVLQAERREMPSGGGFGPNPALDDNVNTSGRLILYLTGLINAVVY